MLQFLAVLALSAQSTTPYSQHEPLAIASVTPETLSVEAYATAEIKIDLKATYDNPFDPDEIAVDAAVTEPDGTTVKVPAFLYRAYRRELTGTDEQMTATEKPDWRLRFTPPLPGKYTLLITAKDKSGTTKSSPVTLTATESDSPGFVKVSDTDNRFFTFDNGTSYWPLGPNICWGGTRGTFDYDDWLPKYGEQGANYSRLWLSPSWTTFGLEQVGKPMEGKGMGYFDLANAWRLDYVMDLAAKNHMYMMLCIESYNVLRAGDAYNWWEKTPQNVANGGPLRNPVDFWTDPKMEKLFKAKLRYLVARYGASVNTLSWEFWNEVDLTADFDVATVRTWHQKMAQYLMSIDPYHHMITTSESNTVGYKPLDLLPELSYFQTHHYGPDPAATVVNQQARKGGQDKPHYVSEVGADSAGSRKEDDPTGIGVHDPLWASIAAGASGNAAAWWWESLIGPNNLYSIYGAAHRYVEGIEWQNENFRQRAPTFAFQAKPAKPIMQDLVFANGPVSWSRSDANQSKRIVIRNGVAKGALPLSGILHGLTNHADLHNKIVFDLTTDRDTTLRVDVGDVSGFGGAELTIYLDGAPATVAKMPIPEGNSSGANITKYAGHVDLKVPKGNHIVTVENTGADWVMTPSISFSGIKPLKGPPVQGWSVIGDTKVLAWVRPLGWDWKKAIKGPMVPPTPPTVIGFAGLASGKWKAEVWDTWLGKPITTQTLQVGLSGGARVPLPALSKDVAVKLTKL